MADQDQVPQGAIPPKVSPFAKPEGAAPMTPVAVPGAPRPITVRLRPTAPTPEGAAPAAAPAAVGIPTPPSANPRATARVPVPEAVAAALPITPVASPTTVRLRPVVPPAGTAAPAAPRPAPAPFHAPGATQSIAHVAVQPPAPPAEAPAAAPLQPQPPPAPGSHPLPDGPKPPSSAQIQAAKSKTSRIALDSAIGVAPMTPMGTDKSEPKTIRLKRPADLAAAPATKAATSSIRQTSRIPDSALPTTPAADSSTVTQKKTLKIKRQGGRDEAAAEGAGEGLGEGVQMTPISDLDFLPAHKESSVFTGFAVAAAAIAAILLVLVTLCLGAHAIGPAAGKNSLASVRLGGFEVPWPGRLTQ